ncbi:hypothetical protein Glove_157g17 [Diversispora epigaea]|uniref:Uncharacterized protein n=1 Tax=Diversispora epigaea TaxID=1348612 RepID=A0A397J0V1_9GLOM|nr:hypothetical protein Glove_157g17 [Diversispora epigaea]
MVYFYIRKCGILQNFAFDLIDHLSSTMHDNCAHMVTYYSFGFENNPNPNNEKSPNSSEEETLLTLNRRRTTYGKNLEQLRLERDLQPQTFERYNEEHQERLRISGELTLRQLREAQLTVITPSVETGSSVGFGWLVNQRNKKIYIYRRRIDGIVCRISHGWNNVNGESVLPGFAIYDKHSSTSQTHEDNLLTPVTTHQFASVGDNFAFQYDDDDRSDGEYQDIPANSTDDSVYSVAWSASEQDEGLRSQEHQRRNYKHQSSLRSQHRRSPLQTFPFFIQTLLVAGLSRTQEPTSQVVEPLPLFIEFREEERDIVERKNQNVPGDSSSFEIADPVLAEETVAIHLQDITESTSNNDEIVEADLNNNNNFNINNLNNIENQNVPGDSSSFEIADPVLAEETVAIHLQDITESTPNNDEIVEADLNNNNNFNINNFGDDNDINNNNENDDNDNNDDGNDDNNNDDDDDNNYNE